MANKFSMRMVINVWKDIDTDSNIAQGRGVGNVTACRGSGV